MFSATVWLMIHHFTAGDDTGSKVGAAAGSDGRSRPLGALPLTQNGPGPAPSTASYPSEDVAARVEPTMTQWRYAIINKDAQMVEALDRAFASHPNEFVSALMASAENDSEERVRSFSTRVLGKLRPPQSAPLMRKLLTDRSEYVRFNAAWALGQLDDRAAVSRLRALKRRDASMDVRRSASDSLRQLEGG